jgi:hypothetical protein
MLQGDLAQLEGYEDKHMFVGEEFEALARDQGFDTAEALSTPGDDDGLGTVGGLLPRIAVREPIASEVMQLWPIYARRYLALLHTSDRSSGYLFWLTKSAFPASPIPHQPPSPPLPLRSTEAEVTGGGMPLRWTLEALAEPIHDGLRVKLGGWCLANPDVKSLRVTINGMSGQTPVWFPRADVHIVLNQDGGYLPWNSLCCGVEGELRFSGEYAPGQSVELDLDIILADNRFVPIVQGESMRVGVPSTWAR